MNILKHLNNLYEKIIVRIYCFWIRIKGKKIILLSNNYIAGFLYEDLKIKYQLTAIGVQIPIKDFIKYVNNIDKHQQEDLVECAPL